MVRHWVTLLLLVCSVPLLADNTLPLPPDSDETSIEDSGEGEGEEDGGLSLSGMEWFYPSEEVWAVEEYATQDWQMWDLKVSEQIDRLKDEAKNFPPAPIGVVAYLTQLAEELSLPWCTNAVPPTLVGDVKMWTFLVTERVAEDGTRTLLTHANNTVFHTCPVPSDFDSEQWSLDAYTTDGVLPDWIEMNAERRAEWFASRGREHLGLSFTMVEPGRLQDYEATLEAQAEAIRREQEENISERPPRKFGPIEMRVDPNRVSFGVYNPEKVDLDVVGFTPLSSPLRTYLGRVPAKGQELPYFETVRPPMTEIYFYRFLNGNQDTDGDGIPDGMELEYFKTDPEKRDTAGSGIDDWLKIFVYGMDATVADSDGDGLPDGWELLHGLDPTSAVGDNGADGDPDGDGLLNQLEFLFGTHPNEADTDGDGLPDREETGYAEVQHHIHGIDTSAAEEIISGEGTIFINFPFPIRLGGRQYAQTLASENGVITFLRYNLAGGRPR